MSDNLSKTTWSIINELTKPDLTNTSKLISLNVSGKLIQAPEEVAEEFNKFFGSMAASNSSLSGNTLNLISVRRQIASMVLSPVSMWEVESVIQNLHSKRSCDVNGMSTWLLKRCYRQILSPLTKLINMSFEQGVFPAELKTAKIIPLFKKDNPRLLNNYRPISILPVLSKVFEKVFFERLMKFLNKFNILSSAQFGFRQGFSTIDAVTNIYETVLEGLENRENIISIFLDLSKAFDCVDHKKVLFKLESCGVRGLPLKWLRSYLSNREQCVEVANALSPKLPINQGVPQGSILGPVLFLMYVNDLETSIQNGKIVQYADDTTLCFKSKSKSDLELDTFMQLGSCIQYFSDINLKINNTKTNYMSFCLRQHDNEVRPAIMMNDSLIEEVDSTCFLGMYLDRSLTWGDHVDHVCARVSSGIYALRNLVLYCSLNVLRTAYFGLIYPHLAYGIRLWGGCSNFRFERAFRLQKKAIRILSKLTFRESCRNAFKELNLLTLPCLYILEVVVYCRFRCELLQGSNVHTYGTRGRHNYRIQQHRTSAFEHIPSQAGVGMINRLPESIKKLTNPKQFKAQLRRLLVSRAFYSLDEFMSCRWEL